MGAGKARALARGCWGCSEQKLFTSCYGSASIHAQPVRPTSAHPLTSRPDPQMRRGCGEAAGAVLWALEKVHGSHRGDAAVCVGERGLAFITIKGLCPSEAGQQQREYIGEGELKKTMIFLCYQCFWQSVSMGDDPFLDYCIKVHKLNSQNCAENQLYLSNIIKIF